MPAGTHGGGGAVLTVLYATAGTHESPRAHAVQPCSNHKARPMSRDDKTSSSVALPSLDLSRRRAEGHARPVGQTHKLRKRLWSIEGVDSRSRALRSPRSLQSESIHRQSQQTIALRPDRLNRTRAPGRGTGREPGRTQASIPSLYRSLPCPAPCACAVTVAATIVGTVAVSAAVTEPVPGRRENKLGEQGATAVADSLRWVTGLTILVLRYRLPPTLHSKIPIPPT